MEMRVSHRYNLHVVAIVAIVALGPVSDPGSIVVLVYEIAKSSDGYGRRTETDKYDVWYDSNEISKKQCQIVHHE
jgi:hypothetical protein